MKTECHLLIVEKDDYLREKIAGVLSRLTRVSSVSQVSNIVKMAGAIDKLVPTLVLIDLKMAANNKRRLEEIKKKHPLMKFYVMNGHSGSSLDAAGLVAADGYFEKSKIVNEVSRLLDEAQCSSLTA